jgi:hypothetical protein
MAQTTKKIVVRIENISAMHDNDNYFIWMRHGERGMWRRVAEVWGNRREAEAVARGLRAHIITK